MAATGILTGTFDPVHLGHLALARTAWQTLGLREVYFVLNADPDHKLDVTGFDDRLAMTRLAIAQYPGLRVYDGLLRLEAHGVTMFRSLMAELAAPSYVFILGQDTLSRLDTWDDPVSVVNLAPYAVASRPGTSHDAEAGLRQRLGSVGRDLRVEWFDLASDQTAASRQIREQWRAGEAVSGLDPVVASYIRDHHLYDN
jgi:nicotinate-nucleotide adenylyltransferase